MPQRPEKKPSFTARLCAVLALCAVLCTLAYSCSAARSQVNFSGTTSLRYDMPVIKSLNIAVMTRNFLSAANTIVDQTLDVLDEIIRGRSLSAGRGLLTELLRPDWRTYTLEFGTEDINALNIYVFTSSVDVLAYDGDSVLVCYEAPAREDGTAASAFSIDANQSQLTISRRFRDFHSILYYDRQLTIYVPSDCELQSVNIMTTFGNIRTSAAAKSARLAAMSGGIGVYYDINSLSASTFSGDIALANSSELPVLDVSTFHGDIDIALSGQAVGNAVMQTALGQLYIENRPLGKSYESYAGDAFDKVYVGSILGDVRLSELAEGQTDQ